MNQYEQTQFLIKNWRNWMAIFFGGIGQGYGGCFENRDGYITYLYKEMNGNKLTNHRKHIGVIQSLDQDVGNGKFIDVQLLSPHLLVIFMQLIYTNKDEMYDIYDPETGMPFSDIIIPLVEGTKSAIIFNTKDASGDPISTKVFITGSRLGYKDPKRIVAFKLDMAKIAKAINMMLTQSTKFFPDIDLNQYRL